MDRATAKNIWTVSNPGPRTVFDGTSTRQESSDEYNAAAETGADVILSSQPTATKTQIKNFYDQCVAGTATLAQMRTAWKVLLETFYKDYTV